MRVADLILQALSALLVLMIIVVLTTIYNQLSDSTLPFLLASGASLSAMISLLLKVRTYRESKWSLYLYVFAMVLMLANSFANTDIHDSRLVSLALSGAAFILTVVTTIKELRAERVLIAEDSGCVIKIIIMISFLILISLAFIFSTFHSMWE